MSEMWIVRAVVMPVLDEHSIWPSVTDVSCPWCESGTIRWAEDGFVPGYRICDTCGQHAIVRGTAQRPVLTPVIAVAPGTFDAAEEGQDVPAGQPYRFRPSKYRHP